MAYVAITAGQVDAESPIDTTLMGKVKDNFIDHEARLSDIETTGALPTNLTVGDYIFHINPYLRSTNSTTSSVKKDSKINVGGALKIKFSLYVSDALATAYGRIYRSRGGTPTAVGTLRSTSSLTSVQFSEDISGWLPGDRIQIWLAVSDAAYTAFVEEVQLWVDLPPIDGTLASY